MRDVKRERMDTKWQLLAIRFSCPECGVRNGKRCRTSTTWPWKRVPAHQVRQVKAMLAYGDETDFSPPNPTNSSIKRRAP